jgi:hypothetical protein
VGAGTEVRLGLTCCMVISVRRLNRQSVVNESFIH